MPELPKLPLEPETLQKPQVDPRRIKVGVKGKSSCPRCGKRLRREARLDTKARKWVETGRFCPECQQWFRVEVLGPTLVDYTPVEKAVRPVMLARERRDKILEAQAKAQVDANVRPIIDEMGRVIK